MQNSAGWGGWGVKLFFAKNTSKLPLVANLKPQDNRMHFKKKVLEITIVEENFMWKQTKLQITIYQPILIFEKCRKMSLLFPCKLKIPFFLVFTIYKVHYNSCHDGCKITILEYILSKNLRIACIQKVCFLTNFEEKS